MESVIVTPRNRKELQAIQYFFKALNLEFRIDKTDSTQMTKEEFENKLNKSKSDKSTLLKTKEDINNFFDSYGL